MNAYFSSASRSGQSRRAEGRKSGTQSRPGNRARSSRSRKRKQGKLTTHWIGGILLEVILVVGLIGVFQPSWLALPSNELPSRTVVEPIQRGSYANSNDHTHIGAIRPSEQSSLTQLLRAGL